MGMYASSKFYESGFNLFKTIEPAKVITLANTQHTNMTSALAEALAWSTAVASSDYVIASNTSGYTLTISSNADLINATTLESTGVANHVCIGSTVNLHYITTCTSKLLSAGDTVTMPSWTIWVKQPTS
jgi:hypothetical protein